MYRIAHPILMALALVLASAGLSAQERTTPPAPQQVQVFQETADARETREQLMRLLRQHPPAVGEVLQRDPSLLTRSDYLAPYPVLWAFLQKHPEIVRNPSFFWTIRTIIDHRRWLRLSRVQAEVHTKLLDRLTTNEDLLTYIQSPAGRRFLESAPIPLDQEPRATTAPVSRIIWSLQAGIVLAALGSGFWFVQQNVSAEAAEGFFIIGVLAVSLGVGFTASAVLAYVVSSRLGLVPRQKSTEA
jgi:hypothetical protein